MRNSDQSVHYCDTVAGTTLAMPRWPRPTLVLSAPPPAYLEAGLQPSCSLAGDRAGRGGRGSFLGADARGLGEGVLPLGEVPPALQLPLQHAVLIIIASSVRRRAPPPSSSTGRAARPSIARCESERSKLKVPVIRASGLALCLRRERTRSHCRRGERADSPSCTRATGEGGGGKARAVEGVGGGAGAGGSPGR